MIDLAIQGNNVKIVQYDVFERLLTGPNSICQRDPTEIYKNWWDPSLKSEERDGAIICLINSVETGNDEMLHYIMKKILLEVCQRSPEQIYQAWWDPSNPSVSMPRNTDNETVVHVAARKGKVNVIQSVMENILIDICQLSPKQIYEAWWDPSNPSISIPRNSNRETILHVASRKSEVKVIKYIMQQLFLDFFQLSPKEIYEKMVEIR